MLYPLSQNSGPLCQYILESSSTDGRTIAKLGGANYSKNYVAAVRSLLDNCRRFDSEVLCQRV